MVIKIKKTYIKFLLTLVFFAAIGVGTYSLKMADAARQQLYTSANEAKISSGYYQYSDQTFEMSRQSGDTLLFFAATGWCNSCSALDEEIMENSDSLPDNLTILKVDFDNDKKTNKKYFVTLQHTLVLLDKNGNEIKRWVGGDFEVLKENFQTI